MNRVVQKACLAVYLSQNPTATYANVCCLKPTGVARREAAKERKKFICQKAFLLNAKCRHAHSGKK